MNLKKIIYKFTNKEKYSRLKYEISRQDRINLFNKLFKNKIMLIRKNIKRKNELNFLHSGHMGDIVNALPVIKQLSKTHKCNLFIQSKKKLEKEARDYKYQGDRVYMTDRMVMMILPLLKKQKYIKSVNFFKNQKIDIDLNLFRKIPMNFNLDEVRWYFYLTGVHSNLTRPYLSVNMHKHLKNKIVIMRSTRRKNEFINYKFLNKFKNILFLGLKDEYNDLKKQIKNLKFYDAKDFLEVAQIIKSSKFFIGNSSFGFTIAEGLKIPRVMEAYPDFPVIYPNGGHGYDFYFQPDFEEICKKLNNL